MFRSRKTLTFAASALFALGLGLWAAGPAQAGPPPTRGYALQQSLKGESPRYSGTTSVRPSATTTAPSYARGYYYPYSTPSTVVRSGPRIVSPVTSPDAPAVTGDATATTSRPRPVVVWYEYVPSLGGWVEFRGHRVSGPPSSR
jgi:hypothetical protein